MGALEDREFSITGICGNMIRALADLGWVDYLDLENNPKTVIVTEKGYEEFPEFLKILIESNEEK